jgi:hypothetical protein
MADNDSDYIGNLSTSRWQSMNASYLNRTPSWMQGEFKQGNRTQQNKYQAPNAGVQQSWSGGEIRDTRTKPGATADAVNAIGQGFVSRNLNRQAQAQQAQQSQQAGQNFYNQYVGLANKAQYQAAFQKAPAPTLPTAPLQPPALNATPYNPALGLSMGQNPTSVSLKSGIGQINQNLANWQSPAPTLPTKPLGAPASDAKPYQGPNTPPTSRTKARGKGWK